MFVKKKGYSVHHISHTWLEIHTDDGWCAQAEVFTYPSRFGIGARDESGNWLPGVTEDALPQSARISRLAITRNPENYGRGKHACVYNYDRGIDFDDAPADVLARIIEIVVKEG